MTQTFCVVEAGLILHWKLLPCPVRSVSTLYLCWSSAPWSCSSVSACICFWWLGCECGIDFSVPRNAETDIEVLGSVGDVECVCILVVFFFFLAWLICMLLAGSCPNRGCHLIKSIICWLNLLELRRKRSVHTFSPVGLFLFCVSLIHWFANEVYPLKISCILS